MPVCSGQNEASTEDPNVRTECQYAVDKIKQALRIPMLGPNASMKWTNQASAEDPNVRTECQYDVDNIKQALRIPMSGPNASMQWTTSSKR